MKYRTIYEVRAINADTSLSADEMLIARYFCRNKRLAEKYRGRLDRKYKGLEHYESDIRRLNKCEHEWVSEVESN